jgi:hypothetical protein
MYTKRYWLITLLAIVLLPLTWVARARSVISPESIIVNPVPAQVGVRVWVGKAPSGLGAPGYYPGNPIHIFVHVTQNSYVYLFNIGPHGRIDLILPNHYSNGGNYLSAGTTRVFPGPGDPFNFTVTGPFGLNRVLAIASRVPLQLGQIAQFQGQGFARVRVRGESGLAHALSIAVHPVPQASWVSAVAYYQVANPHPRPQTGTLQLRSNPSGAFVFVDNQLVGRTPLDLPVRPGAHQVRFSDPGYYPEQTSAFVARGQIDTLSVTLARRIQQGDLLVTSNVPGAEVDLDGNPLGQTPLTVHQLTAGSYRLSVSRAGYQTFNRQVEIVPGLTTVNAQLNPLRDLLQVFSNVNGATVFANGHPIGRIGNGSLSRSLTPGSYQIVVLAGGYLVSVQQVDLTGNQVLVANLNRAP